MKTSNFWMAGVVAVSMLFAACGGGAEKPAAETSADNANEKTEAEAPAAAEKMDVTIDVAASMVGWKGSIMGAHSHTGTLKFTEGVVNMEGDKIVGGSFTVDMGSMATTDENYNEEHSSEMLIGHLSTADFFATEENPTATFTITGMEGDDVVGDLTIRGKTNSEKVTGLTVGEENGAKTLSGMLTVDRQKYDVAYESTMKDMVLSDDIELEIKLVAGAGAAM